MGSRLINIVGKQTFSMNFASGTSPIVIVGGRFFNIQDAVSGVLLVRVESTATMPTGANFVISAANVVSLPDDPANIYTVSGGGNFAQVSVAAADTGFPRLYLSSWTAASNPPAGLQCGISLYGSYGSAAGMGTIVMAVDLLIRDA
jgi:hypothetical protein